MKPSPITIKATIPDCFAAYGMYGDTNDDAAGEAAYDEWLADTMRHEKLDSMFLVEVEESPSFMCHHELKDYGVGSADCQTFVFIATVKEG